MLDVSVVLLLAIVTTQLKYELTSLRMAAARAAARGSSEDTSTTERKLSLPSSSSAAVAVANSSPRDWRPREPSRLLGAINELDSSREEEDESDGTEASCSGHSQSVAVATSDSLEGLVVVEEEVD